MAESITVSALLGKKERYEELIPQLSALLGGERDLVANLANTTAALRSAMNFFWVGFYLVKDKELVLGPFQGTVACTRIAFGKGVCGKAWETAKPILVEDVTAFPGHISCSALSKSEIVIPLFNPRGMVTMVLDIDSDILSDFDEVDEKYLLQVVRILEKAIYE
jgi:L-methionine (R)-S-oxide reductase